MDICYDGALVLPSSYVMMEEEEMSYVEGGGVAQSVAYYAVEVGVNTVINSVLGGAGTIKTIIQCFGKNATKDAIKKALKKWVSVRVANALAGTLLGAVSNFLTFSVGGFVAEWCDSHDGCNDNQIFFSRISL